MKIRYSKRSLQHIENIRQYIEKDSPSAAWVVATFIRSTIRGLEYMPYRGRATEEKDVRRMVVTNYPYVVYYRVRKSEVVILMVKHTSQNI